MYSFYILFTKNYADILYNSHIYAYIHLENMTELGKYLAKRSVNKALVARRTGLSKARIGELTLNPSAKLRADELYLIAMSIGVDPAEMFMSLYSNLTLMDEQEESYKKSK